MTVGDTSTSAQNVISASLFASRRSWRRHSSLSANLHVESFDLPAGCDGPRRQLFPPLAQDKIFFPHTLTRTDRDKSRFCAAAADTKVQKPTDTPARALILKISPLLATRPFSALYTLQPFVLVHEVNEININHCSENSVEDQKSKIFIKVKNETNFKFLY